MKIVKKQTIENEVVEDILCNRCGKSCKNQAGDFDGLIEAEVCGGYYSEKFEDGLRISFSICETCLVDIISNFKIAPKGDKFI